jgi:hypothetical protein
MNNFKEMKYIRLIIIGLLLSTNVYPQFVATTSYGGGGPSPLLDSLFAYYNLEESSGDALDVHGTNDLSLTGSATRQQTGKVNYCWLFAEAGRLGDISTEFDFTGDFSISFWISTTEAATWQGLVSNFGVANYGWEIILDPPDIGWRMRYDGGNTIAYGTTNVNDGDFHHVACSYTTADDSMKVWIDTNLEGEEKLAGTLWYGGGNYFTVASRLTTAYFDGYIDEIAVYRGYEFTQGFVDSLFNSDNGLAYPLDY